MKITIQLGLAFLFLGFISSCQKISKTTQFTANVPVYLSYEDLRSSVENDNSHALQKPGKIFLYNSLILINDYESGIHIYDNGNPTSPSHIAFIRIPGNVDIAVKDNILYADSYTDLVAIDISNPVNAREVGRSQDALSYTIPSGMDWNYPVAKVDESKGVVIGYTIGEVEESCKNEECKTFYNMNEEWNGSWGGQMMSDEGSPVSFSGNSNSVRSASSSNNSAIAGSMARFMMIENYLYVISDENTVNIFDIRTNNLQSVGTFKPWNDANGWGMIETLFTFKEHLFIGSNAGMLAYDISSPASPVFLSSYSHMTSCDPVVANDHYAFITLRSEGNNCNWGNTDQLDILDITDIMNPTEISTFGLSNPHGLDIDSENEILFVCDGYDGLKVYSFDDIQRVASNQLDHYSGLETYDVIVNNGIAHVIGTEGLKQFTYDNAGKLSELSTIPLN